MPRQSHLHRPTADLRALPERPDLRHLKLEAKRRFADGEFKSLQQSQTAIAREHGVASWTQLKGLVEDRSRGPVIPACSFCGRGATEVGHLIAGPEVWICDTCVTTCYGILQDIDHRRPQAGTAHPAAVTVNEAQDDDPAGTASAPSIDATMMTIAHLQQLALAGRRREAQAGFTMLWQELEQSGDHLARVYLAHYTADLQDDAFEEVTWDMRALSAADSAERTMEGRERVRGLRASLHLNAARGLHRLGRQAQAQEQLALAEASQSSLSETGYGFQVRSEIARARQDLATIAGVRIPSPTEPGRR